jgi:hypothetical protein
LKHRFFSRGMFFLFCMLVLASVPLSTGAQGTSTGPPQRIDFAGTRPVPAAAPGPVAAGQSGPPLRIDFQGSRTAPVASAGAVPAGTAGPPLRIDFSGSRPARPH